MSIFELFRNATTNEKAFTEADFWDAISCVDLEYEGDTEALLSTLIRHLEECSDEHIFAFDEKLSELVFTLDGKKWADDLFGADNFSDSSYLSARCKAIAGGKRHYNDILNHREKLTADMGSEAILSAGAYAWAKKHMRSVSDYPHTSKFSTAAHSNEIMWQ